VRIRRSSSAKLEEVSQVLCAERIHLFLVIHDRLEALLTQLTLEDFLLDCPSCEETIGKAALLLTVTPTTSSGLLVNSWIPVRVLLDWADSI
jgi:hypothetical protein